MSPRDMLGGFLSLAPAPLHRLARYGVVGVGVSAVYSLFVILMVETPLRLNATLASVVAFALALPLGWLAHRSVSFSDRPRDRRQPLRFVVSTSANFAVAVGGMYWITELAGHSYLFGIAWNWLVIPTLNFLAYLLWVFRERPAVGSRP